MQPGNPDNPNPDDLPVRDINDAAGQGSAAPRAAAASSSEPNRRAPGEGLEIPPDGLSDDALRGVIETFVLGEGTEYGERDYGLDEKVAQVRAQLARGEAALVFDPGSGSVSITVKR